MRKPKTTIKQEVWATVRKIHRSLSDKKFSEMKHLLHADIVVFDPISSKSFKGVEACLAIWKELGDKQTIKTWKAINSKVHIFRSTAIVHYFFESFFKLGGEEQVLSGHQQIFLVNERARWKVISFVEQLLIKVPK